MPIQMFLSKQPLYWRNFLSKHKKIKIPCFANAIKTRQNFGQKILTSFIQR